MGSGNSRLSTLPKPNGSVEMMNDKRRSSKKCRKTFRAIMRGEPSPISFRISSTLHSKLSCSLPVTRERMEAFIRGLAHNANLLSLDELHFSAGSSVDNRDLYHLVQDGLTLHNIQLKKLSLVDTRIKGPTAIRLLLSLLHHQTQLEELDLTGHPDLFDGQWTRYIAMTSHVLDAPQDHDHSEAVREFVDYAIRCHPTLKRLVLTSTNIENRTSRLILETLVNHASCSNLRVLELDIWVWNYVGQHDIMSNIITQLPQMSSLDRLTLSSVCFRREMPVSMSYMVHRIDFLNILLPNFNVWRSIAPETVWSSLTISYDRFLGDDGFLCDYSHPLTLRPLTKLNEIRERRNSILINQLLLAGLPVPNTQEKCKDPLSSNLLPDWKECWCDMSTKYASLWLYPRPPPSGVMPIRLHHTPQEKSKYNFKACALYVLLRERLVHEEPWRQVRKAKGKLKIKRKSSSY